MKSFKFLIITPLLFVACNNTVTEISSDSLQNIIGSTTNKIEVSGVEWDSFIGKSNSGNFIALRVSKDIEEDGVLICLLYTSPSPRDRQKSRMPSSA